MNLKSRKPGDGRFRPLPDIADDIVKTAKTEPVNRDG